MGGGNVIFYIFLAIMIVLLIRWSIRVFFTVPKPVVTTGGLEPRRRRARTPSEVRRTTVYTINADPRANDPANDFTDFFWDVSPQTSGARAQSAKDDKDLPSYDEVMQMEMRQQVINSTATAGTTAPATSLAPATSVTPVTPLNIVPSAVTVSTV